MRRREFITLIGGAAVLWPLAARAQQPDRMRRIGVLMSLSETDARGQGYITPFRQRLQELGWVDCSNTRIDIRWGAGDSARYHRYAEELVALAPAKQLGLLHDLLPGAVRIAARAARHR
jgi:putative ABC transport system substrate-binding protein